MKTVFRRSFTRDLKKIEDRSLLESVKQVIQEAEDAGSLREIRRLKKMSAPGNFYRIRLGDYRIGLAAKGDEVEFVRLLHRRDIYRYFP